MDLRTILKLLTFAIFFSVSTPNPAPQYYPVPFPGQQPFNSGQQNQGYSAPHPWIQHVQNNFSHPNPSFLDSVSAPANDEIFSNSIPRQSYGVPPPPTSAYPQIYKLDNLIIIANPVQAQPQPCIPQRPPPQFPGTDDTMNKFGETEGDEPSKCTWAIVACCSPGSNSIRYNCFELLGCPGFFFDNSPCESKTVMAAANAALRYYMNVNNTTNDSTNNNRV